MFRRAAAVLGLILSLQGPTFAGERYDAIEARGVLRVGTTGDYKPFSFLEPDGDYTGADIEMMGLVGARLGVRITFVPTTWATLDQDFAAGKFDMAVGGVTILPNRAKLGDFSTPLLADGKRPIARCADQDRYVSEAAIDQPGVRVIVNPGASNEQFARSHFPHAHLIVHKDNASVFDELVAGRADVMVTDGIEVDHQALMHPELCPTHVSAAFTHLEKAYWVQRDETLLTAVNGVISEAKQSGAWDKILNVAQHER